MTAATLAAVAMLGDRSVMRPAPQRQLALWAKVRQTTPEVLSEVRVSIASVDFGRLDAEADVNLSDYFVDTGILEKLRGGKKQFVIGRKGSGKTALFKLSTADARNRIVVPMEFSSDYAWETHKRVREAGLSPESAYLTSWRFSFLAAIARGWAEQATGDARKEAEDILKGIYGAEKPGVLELFIDRFKRLRKLNLPEVPGVASLGGVEFDEDKSGPLLAGTLGEWSRRLQALIDRHAGSTHTLVAIDGLDNGWDASNETKLLLAGVLKAAREINLRMMKAGVVSSIQVFLRSDIYNELQFNDKNKILADAEFLEWSEDRLTEVANARIVRSLGGSKADAWDRVFSTKEMRQRARIRSYVLKRTMGRPRDLLAFVINCQEVARERGHKIVETDDVYVAEERYSRHIYDELDDEMHKQLPLAREYLQALRELGRTRFTLSDWTDTLQRRDKSVDEHEARRRLNTLFDYSVVGVPRRGGSEGGTSFQFVYHDRLLQPNFDQEMIVHASLTKHLRLVEGRKDVGPADVEE